MIYLILMIWLLRLGNLPDFTLWTLDHDQSAIPD